MLRREVLPIRQPKMLPLCAAGFALSIVAALVIGHVERTYPARTPALDVASTHAHRASVTSPSWPVAPLSTTKSRADALYRAKQFGEAAALLRAAASSFDAQTASDMRSVAGLYAKLGEDYKLGMGPGTPPQVAFEALERARVLDRTVGGAFVVEIEAAMAQRVDRAGIYYAAKKNVEAVRHAIRIADSLRVDTSNVRVIKYWLANYEQR
jgi:hypothetical protein